MNGQAWVDKDGYLWLPAGEPGDEQVFCYDETARRRMSEAWPTRHLADVSGEFGLVPVAGGQEEEERIVFLYAAGRSAEVPPWHPAVRGREAGGGEFAEVVPGWEMALLSHGWYFVSEHECVAGVFVVIRRTK